MDNPWGSAHERFETIVLPRLKREGRAIGERAANGDKNAAEVVRLYSMLHRSFDPMTLHLLEQALDA